MDFLEDGFVKMRYMQSTIKPQLKFEIGMDKSHQLSNRGKHANLHFVGFTKWWFLKKYLCNLI